MLKNFSAKTKAIIILILINSVTIYTQQSRIIIDEDFSDWENVQPLYQDSIGDQILGDIDLGNLSVLNDSDYLFIYCEFGSQINLQSDNSVTLYLDTDNNPTTGLLIDGIGAELEYTFGIRSGIVRLNGASIAIEHSEIGIAAAPTVTSDKFEMAINAYANFAGIGQLFNSTEIKILIKDNGAGGDKIPDESGGIVYNFGNLMPEYTHEYSIKKKENNLRVLTYNVEFDGLFDPENIPIFSRILKAIEPDIIIFEEIYNASSQQTADLIDTILNLGQDEQWYHKKQGTDIIAISKFPITSSISIEGNGAFLLDLTPDYDTELLLIGAHPPCCNNNNSRQREIDSIMAFVRDSKNGIGAIPIAFETPIIIAGDMNLVGYEQQLNTFLSGDIFNESTHGPDFNPDWDDSNFEDAKPNLTNSPFVFTWYNEASDFGPGRLDFIFYSGSVMQLTNSFTLFTNRLPSDSLSIYGLMDSDASSASDHLPVVADFQFPNITILYEDNDTEIDFSLNQNYPNPFNPITTIEFNVPNSDEVKTSFTQIKIYDILGNEVAVPLKKNLEAGKYKIILNLLDLSSGVYIYQLSAGNFYESKKMIILK